VKRKIFIANAQKLYSHGIIFECIVKCENSRRRVPIIHGPPWDRTHTNTDNVLHIIYIIFPLSPPSLSHTHSFILFFLNSPHTHTHTHTHRSSSIYRLTMTMDDADDGRREKSLLSSRRLLLVGRRCVSMFNGKLSGCAVRTCACVCASCVGLSAGKWPVKIKSGGESGAPYKNPKDRLCRTIRGKTSCAPP